jgi:hypothetical protein
VAGKGSLVELDRHLQLRERQRATVMALSQSPRVDSPGQCLMPVSYE